MKINGVDMEEAVQIAFDTYYEETFAFHDDSANPFDRMTKEAIFKEGFDAALKVILGTARKE